MTMFFVAMMAITAVAQDAPKTNNAELEAWQARSEESFRRQEAALADYYSNSALWKARMEEANRPLTTKEKLVKVAKYVGDKAVDHVNIRAATRFELGRAGIYNLPTQFATLNSGIAANGAAIRSVEDSILADARANLKRMLAAGEANTTTVQNTVVGVGLFNAAVTNTAASQIQRTVLNTAAQTQRTVLSAGAANNRAIEEAIRRIARVDRKIDQIKKNTDPLPCTPFGCR